MLQAIARLAIAVPRGIIRVAILVFIAAAIFGILVAKGVGSERAREVGTDIVDQLQQSPLVFDVSSAWTMPSYEPPTYEPPTAAADLVSDQVVMEAIAIPLSFLVLVWVLGGHLANCTQLRIVR